VILKGDGELVASCLGRVFDTRIAVTARAQILLDVVLRVFEEVLIHRPLGPNRHQPITLFLWQRSPANAMTTFGPRASITFTSHHPVRTTRIAMLAPRSSRERADRRRIAAAPC
jgi:hypothetical protein